MAVNSVRQGFLCNNNLYIQNVLIRENTIIYCYLLKVIGNTVIVVDRSFSTEAQKFFPAKKHQTYEDRKYHIYLLYEQVPNIFVLIASARIHKV